MKEIRDIVAAYEKARQEGLRTALATVVHVEGSSYRRPGARMLVTETGQMTGAISGGCLEGDALRKARQVVADRNPAGARRAAVGDQHPSPEPRQIGRRGQAGRPGADDQYLGIGRAQRVRHVVGQ